MTTSVPPAEGLAVEATAAGTAPLPGEAGPVLADEPPSNDPTYKWKVLLVVGAGVYMATLDSGIVNVALPVMTREFDATLVTTQWVILAYVLCITGLLLPAGRLADTVGRKQVFLGGFVLFGLASALCGLAPSVGWLIAARILQGVGGALVQSNTGALVTQAFPARERGRALGLQSSIVSMGLLSGPVVGGLITEHFGWRWAFYVNVPISAIAAPIGWRLLRPSPVARGQRFDPAGAFLFLLAAAALLLGLNQGATWGWDSAATVGTLAVSVVAGALFIWVERVVAQPTVDLTLFKNRAFTAAVCSAFLSFMALAGVNLLMPFYMQLVLGLRPDQAGLVLIAIPATVAGLAPISGSLSDRLGSRLIASTGLLLESGGLASLIVLPVQGSAIWTAARLVLVGVGVAFFQSPNSSALFGSVDRSRLGLVGGFQALTRNLGQSLGQAIAGAVWSVAVLAAATGAARAATEAPPEAMMSGFTLVFAASTVVALLAMLTSLLGRPRD